MSESKSLQVKKNGDRMHEYDHLLSSLYRSRVSEKRICLNVKYLNRGGIQGKWH